MAIIIGQKALSTAINVDRLVVLSDLYVNDPSYPDGSGTDWMIEALAGSHYTISFASGVLNQFDVIPTTDFVGDLTVPVRVSDGGVIWSDYFNLSITVISMPQIIGQVSVPKLYVGSYLNISLANLIVTTDKVYPGSFLLSVTDGVGYNIISMTDTSAKVIITGSSNTTTRNIFVTVNDRIRTSNIFSYLVNIVPPVKASKPVGYNVSSIKRS